MKASRDNSRLRQTFPKVPSCRRSQQTGGWVMLALLVVVTALGIGALVLTVSGIRRHRMSERETEMLELSAIGRTMRDYILEEAQIPSPATFLSVLSGRLSVSEAGLRSNRQGNPRIILEDPDLGLGPKGTNKLPYLQDGLGSLEPRNARLLVVSSLGRSLPVGLTNGVQLTTAQFSNLWSVLDGQKPADWNWAGDAGDLCVTRLSLADLFITLVLRYREDTAPHRGRYLVAPGLGTNGHSLLARTPFTNCFLRGSHLSLFGTNAVLQVREVLQDNGRIYTCQDGIWRLGEGSSGSRLGPVIRHPTPEEFVDALVAFLDPGVTLWPDNGGTSKAQMFSAITNFLAQGAYHNQGPGMDDAQSALIDAWVDFTGAQPNKP